MYNVYTNIVMLKLCRYFRRHVPALLTRLAQDGATSLYMAAQNDHVKVVRLLLDNRASVEAVNEVLPPSRKR